MFTPLLNISQLENILLLSANNGELEMHDIASQLLLKWARQGPQQQIAATEDFTRLTLDTIALCSMDFRFNSFYQDDMHPFVKAMNTTLTDANNARQLSGLVTRLMPSYHENLEKSKELMHQISMELVQYRRDHPTEKKDLLNALIYGQDPKTGKTMRDGLIAANMQTFLVAGEFVPPPPNFYTLIFDWPQRVSHPIR